MLPPRVLVRPWWFPAEDLEDPLVFYLEAWLADQVFGPELEILPEIQWMSQALLSVNTVKSGTFVEISVFGRPRVQLHVKSVILSLALRHKEHRAAEVLSGAYENSPASTTVVEKGKSP
ncbi:oocyte-expressed protein-like protein [Camelus ferus]|nr:oocyte-expressed protein-like protein [Camelus ferus]